MSKKSYNKIKLLSLVVLSSFLTSSYCITANISEKPLHEKAIELKNVLQSLHYTEKEKQDYEKKTLSELTKIVSTSNNEYQSLRAINRILKRMYSSISIVREQEKRKSHFASFIDRAAKYFGIELKKDSQKLTEIYNQTIISLIDVTNVLRQAPDNTIRKSAFNKFEKQLVLYKKIKIPNVQKDVEVPYKIKQPSLAQLEKATKQVKLRPDEKKHWLAVVTEATNTKNQNLKIDFNECTTKLQNLEMIEQWLQTSFVTAYKKSPTSPHGTLKELTKEYNRTTDLLAELSYKKQRLERLNKKGWEQPKYFDKQWKKLKKITIYFYQEDLTIGHKEENGLTSMYDFQRTFRSTTTLGKLASIKVMQKLTDTMQQLINEIKATKKYPQKNKTACVQSITAAGIALTNKWKELSPPEKKILLKAVTINDPFELINKNMKTVLRSLEETYTT